MVITLRRTLTAHEAAVRAEVLNELVKRVLKDAHDLSSKDGENPEYDRALSELGVELMNRAAELS